MPGIAGIANGTDAILVKGLGLDHRRLSALGFRQSTVCVWVPRQLNQTHDLGRCEFDLAIPIPDQCLARGGPQGFGGFVVVVCGRLALRHTGDEKTGVKNIVPLTIVQLVICPALFHKN